MHSLGSDMANEALTVQKLSVKYWVAQNMMLLTMSHREGETKSWGDLRAAR